MLCLFYCCFACHSTSMVMSGPTLFYWTVPNNGCNEINNRLKLCFYNVQPRQATANPVGGKHAHPPRVVYCDI